MSPLVSFVAAAFLGITHFFGFDWAFFDEPSRHEREQQEFQSHQQSPRAFKSESSRWSHQSDGEHESFSYSSTRSEGNGQTVESQTSNVTIYTDGSYRYIESNGIPNHETGAFPNPGNPNTISEQSISVKVPRNPTYTGNQTPVQMPGIALNGILLEPGTAEREGNYNIEALQDTYNLGLDDSNAHVQPTGMYHYHGVPEGYLDTVMTDEDMVQVAWAADGFPMYHSHSGAYRSGYELLDVRADGSTPDGTFTQDFAYTNASSLDECNGAWLDSETYVYFITDEFPFIPRCLNGVPDESFNKRSGGAGQPPSSTGATLTPPAGVSGASQGGSADGPPAEALSSCSGKSDGAACSFTAPHGTVSGQCRQVPEGLACVPGR